ncbi:hypothetical protein FPRO05_00827 [Fusarium proliferatum]|uniref:FAD-containing monooxygenase EthA n=1 Tax=Gibberella intermedia TaxID=948311 RepID=A0A365NNQ7_GIBIN|nr:hypothetical protein FPRO05_00827 [Fusarium proliferatum]
MAPHSASGNSSLSASFDVLIIGAGISGINIAYHVQNEAPEPAPSSYAILESRSKLGGTWDFFKYPGLRSDSDMFTFGLPWYPWRKNKTIASGAEISSYLEDAATHAGIHKNIKYQHRVLSAYWSSQKARWTLDVEVNGVLGHTYEARFLVLGTGYYDYDEPLATLIPGLESFSGTVVHPQFWPEDLDYAEKDVVIIGSGATAVTLLPNLTDKAKHTTMLQRSPTYISPLPLVDKLAQLECAILPARLAGRVTRLRRAIRFFGFYWFCKFFPNTAKRLLRNLCIKLLPPNIPVEPHFTPRYDPMDQRLCACPDGDFFASLRSGKASIVTDVIRKVTEDEIILTSGTKLRPDIIVTATGLKLRIGGGIQFFIDDDPISIIDGFAWKGFMLQNVPNLAFVAGYYNAAWTLGAEVTGVAVVRLLRQMKSRGFSCVVPRLAKSDQLMEPQSFFKISSTYVKDAIKYTPKGGTGQWAHRWNYFFDLAKAYWGDFESGLEYF